VSDAVSVEAEGDTVGEAKWAAIRALERTVRGLDRTTVRFQVVSEGERGLLGVGHVPARVIATADPGTPAVAREDAGLSGAASLAAELADRLVAALGLTAATDVVETDTEVQLTIRPSDPGILIGRHGQTIDAIQHLANALSYREQGHDRKRVVVEVAGYRERRIAALEALARDAADRAARAGTPQELEPMSAADRRVVHEFLKDHPVAVTSSSGVEPERYVVVAPRAHA
jgi:spoIIIJ-associated protein